MAFKKCPRARARSRMESAMTGLPNGLEGCVEDRLLAEIERLRKENAELRSKQTANAAGNGAASPGADAELRQDRQRLFMVAPASKEVDAVRNRIRTAVLRSVKKAAHNSKTRPWSEVVEAMTPDMADACALTSRSRLMAKRSRGLWQFDMHSPWFACSASVPLASSSATAVVT